MKTAKYFNLFIISSLFLSTHAQAQYVLKEKWQTEAAFQTPESVIEDVQTGLLYVSNINGKPSDKDGNGFISVLNKSGKIKTLEWVKNLDAPKGMGIYKGKLYVSDLNKLIIISGIFYNIQTKDKKIEPIAQNIPSGDGIVEIEKNVYLISNWNGEINLVQGDKVTKLLDTKDQKINAADIWYLLKEKLVLVPTFWNNKVVAYELSK